MLMLRLNVTSTLHYCLSCIATPLPHRHRQSLQPVEVGWLIGRRRTITILLTLSLPYLYAYYYILVIQIFLQIFISPYNGNSMLYVENGHRGNLPEPGSLYVISLTLAWLAECVDSWVWSLMTFWGNLNNDPGTYHSMLLSLS